MKTSNKVIVSCLAFLSGASLVGSVTGTIAWYQYATRAQIAYTGATAHCSKLLQISLDDGDDNIENNNWSTRIGGDTLVPLTNFAPVTTGEQKRDEAIALKTKISQSGDSFTSPFYGQPKTGQGLYDNWLLADSSNFAQFSILVRVKDVDANADSSTPTFLENNVYITDLVIQDASSNGSLDLSKSVRVHISSSEYHNNTISSSKNALFAKEDTSVDVGGFLDLDNDGILDSAGYEFDQINCLYGAGTQTIEYDDNGNVISDVATNIPKQTSYSLVNEKDSSSSDFNDIIAREVDGDIVGGKSLGKTSSIASEYLKVTVTIWLEGWSILQHGLVPQPNSNSNNNTSSDSKSSESLTVAPSNVWDSEYYTEKSFNVGLSFGVKSHSSEDHQ